LFVFSKSLQFRLKFWLYLVTKALWAFGIFIFVYIALRPVQEIVFAKSADSRGVSVVKAKHISTIKEYYDNLYAVIIGIDKYEFCAPLQYAASDARSFYTTLRRYGFNEENIFFLQNKEASKISILSILGEHLPKRTMKNDGVVVFFAGHGVTHKEKGKEYAYIMPVDAKYKDPKDSGISMDLIQILFEKIPAKHVLFIVDACHSGFSLQRSGFDSLSKGYVKKVTQLRARQVITAGGKDESALETGGHGLFTEKLLFALEGPGDLNYDGVITVSELGTYLRDRVSRISLHRQTPLFGSISGEGEFVFIPINSNKDNLGKRRKDRIKLEQYELYYGEALDAILKEDWKSATSLLKSALKFMPNDPWAQGKLKYIQNRRRYRPKIKDKFDKTMILIPAGNTIIGYNHGFPNEKPERVLFVDDFYMDETEVTQNEYNRFMDSIGNQIPQHLLPEGASGRYLTKPSFWMPMPSARTRNLPVVGVTWYQAYAYAKWIGKRLPTEIEWEKASRGEKGNIFPWGNNWNQEILSISHSSLAQIKTNTKDLSPYGVFDLAGNVREWVVKSDEGYMIKASPMDRRGTTFAICRGGDYTNRNKNDFRAYSRTYRHPAMAFEIVGFRCSADLSDQ